MSTSQDTLTDNSQEHYQEPRTTTTADEDTDTIMDHKSSDDKVPIPNSPLSGRTTSLHDQAGTTVERSASNRVEEKAASGNANGSTAQGLPRPKRYSHGCECLLWAWLFVLVKLYKLRADVRRACRRFLPDNPVFDPEVVSSPFFPPTPSLRRSPFAFFPAC
jgi:hypothetical protein